MLGGDGREAPIPINRHDLRHTLECAELAGEVLIAVWMEDAAGIQKLPFDS